MVCRLSAASFMFEIGAIQGVPAASKIILTWYRRYRDHEGGSPRKRPFHCTSVGLTPAITPNVGNSGTQFISVGVCVRAYPCSMKLIVTTPRMYSKTPPSCLFSDQICYRRAQQKNALTSKPALLLFTFTVNIVGRVAHAWFCHKTHASALSNKRNGICTHMVIQVWHTFKALS